MANILLAYYSRTGHTARLANTLATEMRHRGHRVEIEAIQVERDWNKWLLPLPLLPLLPLLPVYLLSKAFRRLWLRIYNQHEQSIRPLSVPDVSNFDMILLGTPKWLYISYPVARYLKTVKGMAGKPVGPFATFCGPPLEAFEIEMLFEPLESRLMALKAVVVDRLTISSGFHPFFFFNEMERVFRYLSLKVFGRPLVDFSMDGDIGRAEIQRFCDEISSWRLSHKEKT